MSVYSISESHFAADKASAGMQATAAIWADMRGFDGYLSHDLVQDVDDAGHLIVVSRWRNREAADAAMSYASHPNVRRVEELVSEPRRRTVGVAR